MIRGTTPTHSFTIPIEAELIKEILITYKQADNIIVEKRTADCVLEEGKAKVTLTQEDTLKFDHVKLVEVQMRILTTDQCAIASYVKRIPVGEVLNSEVLE